MFCSPVVQLERDTWILVGQHKVGSMNPSEDVGTYWINLLQTEGETSLKLELSLTWSDRNSKLFQKKKMLNPPIIP